MLQREDSMRQSRFWIYTDSAFGSPAAGSRDAANRPYLRFVVARSVTIRKSGCDSSASTDPIGSPFGSQGSTMYPAQAADHHSA
jgi:hypothetical protein